jgi:hypothetical protein
VLPVVAEVVGVDQDLEAGLAQQAGQRRIAGVADRPVPIVDIGKGNAPCRSRTRNA